MATEREREISVGERERELEYRERKEFSLKRERTYVEVREIRKKNFYLFIIFFILNSYNENNII
jgi:hypothetical protein